MNKAFCTSVASLFPITNDRINALLSLVCCELMRAREKSLIHLGVTFMRKSCSRYNGAANLISHIISPVLRSEMRLAMPRCIKFKWNGAKVAQLYSAEDRKGARHARKCLPDGKGGKGKGGQ